MENKLKVIELPIDEFELKIISELISFDPDITNRIGDIHNELFCKKLITSKRDINLNNIL